MRTSNNVTLISKGLKGLPGKMKCINELRKGSATPNKRMFHLK